MARGRTANTMVPRPFPANRSIWLRVQARSSAVAPPMSPELKAPTNAATTPPAATPAEPGPDAWELRLVNQIRSAKPGDATARAAWEELLTTYQDRLFAMCAQLCRDREVARDLTQETFVKVIQGFDSYDGRARLITWMTRIAMNVTLSHLRRQKLRRHASLDGFAGPIPGAAGGEEQSGGPIARLAQNREPGAERGVEKRETGRALWRSIETLDPDHQAVLVLRDFHDLDYQEIADVLGVRVGTVKSRLFRARTALRDVLEREGKQDI